MYSRTMWNKQRFCWQLQNHVWIQNFRRMNWKINMLGKSAYFYVVDWHGRSCQEMCGTILWVGEQDDSTTAQSTNSMPWRPPFQGRRTEIRGRLVKILRIQNLHQVEHCAILKVINFPISWMCNKQTSVSHRLTESEIISLDAGLRFDGIPALVLWDLIVAVLHGNTNQSN